MNLRKILSLIVILFLGGCVKEVPEDSIEIVAVDQASMQLFFDQIEMDVEYPYGLDYFIKAGLTTVELIEEYWFEMKSPNNLVVGENNIIISIIQPDKQEVSIQVLVTCHETDFQYETQSFQFDTITQTITGITNNISSLIIPEKIDDIKVLHIGEEAFQDKMIAELYLPNTIISIGARAFEGNTLSSLILPPSVEVVGQRAFARNEFTKLTIEARNLTFDDFVLANNPFEEITVKDDIDFELLGKNWVRSGLPIDLMPGIEEEQGIYYSEDTKTVYDVVTRFDNLIFSQTINPIIERLNIEHIGDYAFYQAEFAEFSIPETIKTIGKKAYSSSMLYEITIPELVNSIDDQAFYDCHIQILNLYDNISYFGSDVFSENELIEINVFGNEIHYNEHWEEIGLPIRLLPQYREPIPTLTSWLSSREVDHIESILHENVVYGVGFTWGNDGDFQHDLDLETVDFIYKFNIQTKEKKTVLFLDPVYYATGIVKGSNDTLIVSAYRFIFDTKEYFPYLLYYDFNLNLLEAKPIQASITLPHRLYINDSNQLLIVASPSQSYPMDQVLILEEDGDIIYQYIKPNLVKKLSFFDVCVDGDDFILVGQVEKMEYTSDVNGVNMEGYILRINANGVVWEKRYGHVYRLNHYKILKLNETSYLVQGTRDITETYEFETYFYKIDHSGNVVADIDLSSINIGSVITIELLNNTIYVMASTEIGRMNSELLQFSLDLELIKRDSFIKFGFRLQFLSEENNQLLIIGDSQDRYLVNNTMLSSTQLHLFYYPK